MRQLKFKGYDTVTMADVEFTLEELLAASPKYKHVDVDKVRQYIGHDDKNGEAIYAGDIVEEDVDKWHFEREARLQAVAESKDTIVFESYISRGTIKKG